MLFGKPYFVPEGYKPPFGSHLSKYISLFCDSQRGSLFHISTLLPPRTFPFHLCAFAILLRFSPLSPPILPPCVSSYIRTESKYGQTSEALCRTDPSSP